ncbi:MAG: enoyl-CoA hydratase/isomerase family protein [Candidatus Kariarchaeaceae archaeon]|jgi:enoyl-CoA hydratase
MGRGQTLTIILFNFTSRIAIRMELDTLKLLYDTPVAGVATLMFSRPKALNAMNSQMITEMETIVSELEGKSLRALVMTGEGDRAFVAGADIAAMVEMSSPEARSFLYSAQQVLNRFESLPYPVIAKINGYALGGGLEIALACDIRIASSSAVVGLPEVSLGLIPAAGGTQRLTKIVGQGKSKYLIMTGKRLKADEALTLGIVNEVVAPEELDARILTLLDEFSKLGPIAVAAAKRSIEVALSEPLTSGLEIELNNAIECFQSSDLREGMRAFLERRPAEFKGQ